MLIASATRQIEQENRRDCKSENEWVQQGPATSGSQHSTLDRFRNNFREFLNVFFRRIERTHPAHDRFFFDPHVEKVMLPDLLDGMMRNLREDAVGFDLPNYFDFRNAGDFFLQEPRHAVGVFGASPPEVMGQ